MAKNSNDIDKVGKSAVSVSSVMDNLPNFGMDGIAGILSQLAENFVYIEPLMGPFDKEKYLKVFGEEYDVRGAVPDLDYGLQVSSSERDDDGGHGK